jgi:D-ribose pyranase
MKKSGVLNSHISKVLADLGHTDIIVIADAGLPVPNHVAKIDLALKPGTPSFQEVVRVVSEDMVVEKIILASEIKKANSSQNEFLTRHFHQEIEYVEHEEFKKMTEKAKVIIRTGEITPYSNCILQAGVIF